MTNEYFISIFLDVRRAKQNGKYPVKLRVFTPMPRTQKLYATPYEFTKDEFHSIWETTKPRKEHKEDRLKLQAIEARANEIANQLSIFSFDAFERLLFSGTSKTQRDIQFYYQQAIALYNRNQQIGTAESYSQSLKTLIEFSGKTSLAFHAITPQWLKDYERFMTDEKKRSKTTIGIYLRPLRAIFNTAISDKVITADQYPFGRKKYSIPAPQGVKKALTKEQLKLLFETEPISPDQQKAKAFWFFSYSCNGMNFKDIACLQYKNINGDTLSFVRAKTANTNKKQAPATVYLSSYAQSIIEQYGNQQTNPESLLFPIIEAGDSKETQHRKIGNFVRFVNQHFSKFAKSIGIKEQVSTYWARHSFATNAIRSGASMEFVSEALRHSNLKTTQAYFAGFEDEKKREISNKLFDFNN
jgi:site-specific recombinase XerD